MRKKTVKLGLNYLFCAIVVIIIATFFHDHIAWLFLLTPAGESDLTIAGIVIGGICGGFGVLIVALGFLQTADFDHDVRLKPIILALAAALFLFMMLLYSSFTNPPPPKLHPGETITI